MNAKRLIFLLSAGLLLSSCGQASSSYYSYPAETSSYYPAQTSSYYPAQTSSYQPPAQSSSADAYREKLAVINYLKIHGTQSGTRYGIVGSAPYGSGFTVTDVIMYDSSDDTFMSAVSLDYSDSSGSVSNFAGFSFTWGNLRYADFLGSTTYKVSSTSLTNYFSFNVAFSSYPSFQVTGYRTVSAGYPKAASNDASVDGDCLIRAINNVVKTFPSMGCGSNLW